MGEGATTDNVKRVERELAKEDRLMAKMLDQAPGMIGMASMFVVTIGLGIWLRPFYDSAELHAFGEAGTTQGRWIVMELAAIFAFTFIILFLAKRHMEKVIKYGLLFVLFLALCYTTVPGAHLLLIDAPEPANFEFDAETTFDEKFTAIVSTGEMITQSANWDGGDYDPVIIINKRSGANPDVIWSTEVHTFPGEPDATMIEGEYGYTFSNGAYAWTLDKESGALLSKYACYDEVIWADDSFTVKPFMNLQGHCSSSLEVVEHSTGELNDDKGALYIMTIGNQLVRRNTFHGLDNFSVHQAEWSVPQLALNEQQIHMEQMDTDHLMLASRMGAIIIELEESNSQLGGVGEQVGPASSPWYYFAPNGDNISSFAQGASPYDEGEDFMFIIGYDSGNIDAFTWDGIGVLNETRVKIGNNYPGPIQALALQDLTENDVNELWIASADGIHGLYGESLVEMVSFEINTTGYNELIIANSTINIIGTEDETILLNSGPFTDEMYNIHGMVLDDTASLIGLLVAVVLMVALIWRPEWYVVNTVGILVGAGVVVMLGVTFVPTLIMIFMILAAIYDAWAVYKSKHMLDLADTMIGLNLPILLVAPQEKGYSMLNEQDSIKPLESAQTDGVPKKRKKSKEAMFMGLGDVIFPGMLVVSCIQWIAVSGFAVGMGALIGGLVGYFALMGFVASGRPQAGLPLLNGGAILGYLIAGMIFVGTSAFKFGLSF
jgi:presenilin-like A22 family membrane protease